MRRTRRCRFAVRGACAVLAVALVAVLALAGGAAGATRVETGVVVVQTTLGYAGGSAAGTGMVVSPSGLVLTNNHVIKGATAVKVVVPSTRRSYAARVVGYSISPDVAVLRLTGASGLATVRLGTAKGLAVGQSVTAVGNAGGTGTLVASSGTVKGLNRTITVSDDQGGSVRLTGLIRTSAQLEPGDSGGPLLDGSGRVIGMDTAASTSFIFGSSSGGDGWAIPVDRVVTVMKQVQAGRSTASVHVGPTAFLGILGAPSRQSDVSGALVVRAVSGGPADRAGIGPGDVITQVDGRKVASTAAIAQYLMRKKPGQTVKLIWVDRFLQQESATVKLASGPPQ